LNVRFDSDHSRPDMARPGPGSAAETLQDTLPGPQL